ncbi:MAG: hypothetical protein SO044_02275, partial [Agathobaculum sp.]|uniref:hypothetical protein n=1 Tax=Agathobaculum sp. TaxID=2048138 RepID=UPI002A82C028
MATLRVYPIKDTDALRERIKYSYDIEKTACPDFFSCTGIPGTLSTAINCCCQDAFEQMMETKRR